MFDSSSGGAVPDPAVAAHFDELFERHYPTVTPESAVLVERIWVASRQENRAAAARLVAIGELFALRLSRCAETEDWAIDTMEAVAAEVAAALRISQGQAGSYLRYARAMRERLPRSAAAFRAGDIDYRTFQTVVYRTDLITDADTLATVDAELAVALPRWPSMTPGRLAAHIDRVVGRADADAVRQRRDRQVSREIWVTQIDSGMAELGGTVSATAGLAFDKRLAALAATVCDHDPRTVAQRRADALEPLAAGADRLGCRCERADCPAGGRAAGPVVIHVVAGTAGPAESTGVLTETGALIPPELLAELGTTARHVPLVHPGDAPPEPRYTPSKALADFVRCRDLTCRFPGCDRPASAADLDHTIPYGRGGKTHASNLKCLCRLHHLVKTFWGWRDRQLRDATVIWTAPSGDTYVTTPGSALLFPTLCAPTGALAAGPTPSDELCGERTAMMPTRRRTRAQNRAHAVAAERRANHRGRAAGRRDNCWTSPGPVYDDDEPPPF